MSVGGLEPQTSYSLEVTPILKQMLMEPTPQQSIQTSKFIFDLKGQNGFVFPLQKLQDFLQ